jgi:hypothetical protein
MTKFLYYSLGYRTKRRADPFENHDRRKDDIEDERRRPGGVVHGGSSMGAITTTQATKSRGLFHAYPPPSHDSWSSVLAGGIWIANAFARLRSRRSD